MKDLILREFYRCIEIYESISDSSLRTEPFSLDQCTIQLYEYPDPAGKLNECVEHISRYFSSNMCTRLVEINHSGGSAIDHLKSRIDYYIDEFEEE